MPELIGPLTAEEWCSFRLTGGDDDPLVCCGATSELRDAIFETLRQGATPTWGRLAIGTAWREAVKSHDEDGFLQHPLLRKLYDAYVKGTENDRPAG